MPRKHNSWVDMMKQVGLVVVVNLQFSSLFYFFSFFLSHLVGPLLWCTNSHDKKCNVGGTAIEKDNSTSQICLETWEGEIKQSSIFKPPLITDWRGGWEVFQLVFHQHLLP